MPGNLEGTDHISLPKLSGWICLSASATNMGFDTFDFSPHPGEMTRERNMSTTALDPKRSEGTPAPLPHNPASATTLVLMGFAAVYIVWGSTYLAIRIGIDRKSTRLNSSHQIISYAVFCLKKKKNK